MSLDIVLDKSLKMPDLSKIVVAQPHVDYFYKALGRIANERGKYARLQSEGSFVGAGMVQYGFVGLLSQAYSSHLPVAVGPHDLWYIANCELAARVAKEPETFRHLFSESKEKQTLMVPTANVTHLDYAALRRLLEQKIPTPGIVGLLVPELSTVTGPEHLALCASLADAMQHYYEYMTFCCGIPSIRVRGTKEDWLLLSGNANMLAATFHFHADTAAYYEKISNLFDQIAQSFDKDMSKFWRSIFTQENVGSGSQVEIDGWITDFFSSRGRNLESFETSISLVPYKNLETQREFLGVTGAFHSSLFDGFYYTNYSQVTFEKVES
jgi:hypothetical protein